MQESLRKQGRTSNLLLLLALVYEGLEDWTRAETLTKTLAGLTDQLDPRQREQVKGLQSRLARHAAGADASIKDLSLELDRLNAALQGKPGDAGLLGSRGEVLFRLQRYAAARQDLQDSLKKDGWNSTRLILLARACEALGDRDRAFNLAKAVAAKPDLLDATQKQQVRELLLRLRPAPAP